MTMNCLFISFDEGEEIYTLKKERKSVSGDRTYVGSA